MENIYQIVAQYEKDFRERPVKVVEGYEFNQIDTLKRINLYSCGKFVDGNKDEYGEKVFFDITTPVVRNAAKNLDLDTKDVRFQAVNGATNYFRSWLYRRKAKDWMWENKIAHKLNKIPEKVSGTGSIVVKRIEGARVFDFVNLNNFACDASADRLEDGWTIERHYYTPNELKKQIERGWDKEKIETAIKDFRVNRKENFVGDHAGSVQQQRGKDQYICVREFYGYVEKSHLTNNADDTDLTLCNFILVLPDTSGKQATGETGKPEGLTLFREEVKDLGDIYKELHYRKVPGRWLGRGLYEECFPMQEVENTRNNWMLMAMRISQLIVFQTRDKTVLQNVLTDIQNGTILKFGASKVNADMLQRVDTQVRDHTSSNLLDQTVQRTIQNLSNAYEVTTGESLPSGTPFSLGALINQNANKLFEFIREDYGIFLEEIFNDWVLPQLEKEMKGQSFLEIVDRDDLEYVQGHLTNFKIWDSIKKALMSGIKPTKAQVVVLEQFIRGQLEKQESMFLDIPEGFLSYEKKVRCSVTDESESPTLMTSLMTVMQMVTANPAIIELPGFQKILDMIGLGKADVIPTQIAGGQVTGQAQMPAQQGAQPVAA